VVRHPRKAPLALGSAESEAHKETPRAVEDDGNGSCTRIGRGAIRTPDLQRFVGGGGWLPQLRVSVSSAVIAADPVRKPGRTMDFALSQLRFNYLL